jgi:hypothetical protein
MVPLLDCFNHRMSSSALEASVDELGVVRWQWWW